MPWLRKFGKVWYLGWSEAGKSYTRRVSQTKQIAEEALARKKEELERRRWGLNQRESWLAPFVDSYLTRLEGRVQTGDLRASTLRRVRESFAHLIGWLEATRAHLRRVQQLSPTILEEYRVARRQAWPGLWRRRARARTINVEMTLIGGAFKMAAREGTLSASPFEQLQPLRERDSVPAREISPAQVRRLVQLARPELRPYLIGLAYTGARRGELFNVGWDDVDFENRMIRLLNIKTHRDARNRDRWVPMHPKVRTVLKSRRGLESPWPPLPAESLRRMFRQAVRGARLEGLRIHDLRHACASALVNEGVDLYLVGKLLGHRDLKSTDRYAHLQSKALHRAVAKLRF